MVKVNLFNEDIELDKTIYVSLDGSMDLFTMFPESMKDYCYAGDFKRLCQFIKEKRPCIITCLTECVSVQVMELGYEIIVQSGNKFVKFSELLNGDSEKSFGREIRQTHNWEKMLYSGCFDLDIPDWY